MNISTVKIDHSNLLFRLGQLTRRWRQTLDSEINAAGLTNATCLPLLHLYNMGDGVHQKELAASVGIEGPSIVRLLDTLVAKGLVERSEDAKDRRAKQLQLTQEGQKFVLRVQKIVTSLDNEVLSPFSDTEISLMAELIQRLESSVNNMRRRTK